MSRTVRRKHAEQLVKGIGYSHVAGVYSEYDYVFDDSGHGGMVVYREPTKRERYLRFAQLHLEKEHYKFKSMDSWARRLEQKRDRAKHRNHLNNFVRGSVEDVVIEKRSIFPKQYW